MKENGVDLNQQRHYRQAKIEAGCYSQGEAGEHLRKEFEHKSQRHTSRHSSMQQNVIHTLNLTKSRSLLVSNSFANEGLNQ